MHGVSPGTRFSNGTSAIRSDNRFVMQLLILAAVGMACMLVSESAYAQLQRIPASQKLKLQKQESSANQPLVDIQVEGNVTIPAESIFKYIKVQKGRVTSPTQIRDDVRSLYSTRWFFSVEPKYRQTDRGMVLVFRVVERPMVRKVEFRGNDKVRTKYLVALTGLKPGAAFDVSANRESVRRIESHYKDKGYRFAKVKLLKGDSKEDRDVIFQIDEGKKVIVSKISFDGNEFISDALLKTKLQTKTALFRIPFLGGKFDPATIPNDIAALERYYNSLGFFDVEIEHKIAFNSEKSRVYLKYTVTEGLRYQVRNLELNGNRVLDRAALSKDFKLSAGDYFNGKSMQADITDMKEKYGKLGRMFAKVDARRKFLEEPGWVDLVYNIDEDVPHRIRRININIQGDHPHTKDTVALNRMFSRPGDLADPTKIRRDKRRLEGAQVFERGPQLGPRINISRVKPDDVPKPEQVVRGQDGDFIPPFQSPASPIYPNSPLGDPFGNPRYGHMQPPSWIDLDIDLAEAQTGRLMFGVGVNSDAGVVGNIALTESNFDILRPPRSPREFLEGTAWRGGGQQFRMEAVPGNVVSRYLISWTDPYFMDTDYSLGVSGFYFNRFYPDWDEDRVGGRVSVGKQLTNQLSISGAIRLEDVKISGADTTVVPTIFGPVVEPKILDDAVGNTFLSTFRGSVTYDTRDAAFLPAEGYIVTASLEQAFGDYKYPRAEIDGSKYFTIFSRPDGGGRHILALNAQAGWTDTQTPIFERYYAGGFQTFRGFEFRGVAPEERGVKIGGRWQLLGGAEYMFPVTANEMVQAVAFTDIGTVEENVSLDAFRMTAGIGLRLTIPAMGPAPIALDFAFPISKQDEDDTQVFSFYVGFTR